MYDNQCAFVTYDKEAESWIRKHLGTALVETEQTIVKMINNATKHFDKIIETKQKMCNVEFTDNMYGAIMGKLYFQEEYMKAEQTNIIREERKNPTFDYSYKGTVWEFFKHISYAMIDSSPKEWLIKMQKIHHTIINEFNLYEQATPISIVPESIVIFDALNVGEESEVEAISFSEETLEENRLDLSEFEGVYTIEEASELPVKTQKKIDFVKKEKEEIKKESQVIETDEEGNPLMSTQAIIIDITDNAEEQECILAENDLKEEILLEETPSSPILVYEPLKLNPFDLEENVFISALDKVGVIKGIEGNRYAVEIEAGGMIYMNPLMLQKIEKKELIVDDFKEKIEDKMRNLYSTIKPYTHEVLEDTIAVTISETNETFFVNI